jgi:chloramphenicol-sensitive protein RarD
MLKNPVHQGLLYGFLAYSIWGFFPLFFHLLRHVDATEVLAHRVIWSLIFCSFIIFLLNRKDLLLRAIARLDLMRGLFLSSLLVSSNWLIFIWAVARGQVLECSLGYFITPLVSVFLARLFLKEKLNIWRLAAIVLAGLGILWFLLKIGYLPWVSLSLAISFGLYGLVRKKLEVDTLTGLTLETAILFPLAILYWVYLSRSGLGQFNFNLDKTTLLLLVSGVLTALPLLLFASAAKKLSLTAIGFMMYINPSLQFLSAIYILQEPFNLDLLIGFCFIWAALLVFSAGSLRSEYLASI